MELKTLKNINNQEWDQLISQFKNQALFHQSAWLDFIGKTQGGKKNLLKIIDDTKIIGYFPCFVLRKGPFKILGSPLLGWSTEFMGPIINNNCDQLAFLHALDNYCREYKIDHCEISNPILNPEIMKKFEFKYKKKTTFIVTLSHNNDSMWLRLNKKSCRWAINKALKNNLKVENTNNSEVVDEFYEEMKEVFLKQNLVPTYSYAKIKFLFDCLKQKNLLLTLQVKHNNKIIATGFFPYDKKCIYFWGGASWREFQHLCPNELLHWTVMTLAAEKGITEYDLAGTGPFKAKFGGELTSTYHWYKSYNHLARVARFSYQHYFYLSQKIKGITKKFIKNYVS